MFLSKVEDQKFELLRALFRNLYYKEKCSHLDSECKMLADSIISTQMVRAEENEKILMMRKELTELQKSQNEKLEELQHANEVANRLLPLLEEEQSSMSYSVNEDKSIREVLQIKNEMIKCLQEQLVKVRLNQAETRATIRDLKQTERDLENEKEILSEVKPETVSRLQEEFMAAKLRETQIKMEFDDIKRFLTKTKLEIRQHIEGQSEAVSVDGDIKLSSKGVLWQGTSNESKKVKDNPSMEMFQAEMDYLREKIPELGYQIELMNKQLLFKEKERGYLQEQLSNSKIKEKSVESMIAERKRQCEQLDATMRGKLECIRASVEEKDKNIEELSRRFKLLSREQDNNSSIESSVDESTLVQNLEEEIRILKEKITQLQNERSVVQ